MEHSFEARYIDISSFRIDTEKLYWYISVTGADSALNTAETSGKSKECANRQRDPERSRKA